MNVTNSPAPNVIELDNTYSGGMDAASLLRRCRQRAGLTQRQLARSAGTSAASICLYESGDRIPRTDTLMRLVAATGASVHLGVTVRNPVDAEAADRSFQAVLALVAALPYDPANQMASPVFATLAS